MAQSITGAQGAAYISGALGPISNFPTLMTALSSWKGVGKIGVEKHLDIGSARTVSQKVSQEYTLTLTGRDIDGAALALMANDSSTFLNGKGTAKYHIRIVGNGTDGKFDRTFRYCVLTTPEQDNSSADKGMTWSLAFDAEELV